MLFISYRRNDDAGHAGRLHDYLKQSFSSANIFMDVMGSIAFGVDWDKLIRAQAASRDVMLAVIGKHWAQRWADDPTTDYVLLELRIALEHGKHVIPVLVDDAADLRRGDLPEPIRALANRQAIRLSNGQFGEDCHKLVARLHELLAPRETADWQAASATGTPSSLHDFLEKWPHGKHAESARERNAQRAADSSSSEGITRRHLARGALVVGAGALLEPDRRPSHGWPQCAPNQYFQSFDVDGDEGKKRQELGDFWLLGDDGVWTGAVDNGVYRLINRAHADGAKRFNVGFTAPDGQRRALGNAPVSVDIRIQSRADAPVTAKSSAGLIYRFEPARSDYLALTVASAGYRLLQRQDGKLRELYAERYSGAESAGDFFQNVGILGRGRQIQVYINHQFVRAFEVDRVEGDVGVIAISTGVFEFDNLSVWQPGSGDILRA